MTKELKKQLSEIDVLREPMAMGDIFVESGMFPDVKTQAQAVVKILAGKEMGLTPFESMNSLYIVNGKVAVMANAMASILKKNPKYDYEVKVLTETECKIDFFEINGERRLLGTSDFTFKDGAKAGLVNREVWKSYPRNMLFARALSNGVRFFCPDASYGYTVEELKDVDTKRTPVISKEESLLDRVLELVKEKYPSLEERKVFLSEHQIVSIKDCDDNTLTHLEGVLNG